MSKYLITAAYQHRGDLLYEYHIADNPVDWVVTQERELRPIVLINAIPISAEEAYRLVEENLIELPVPQQRD